MSETDRMAAEERIAETREPGGRVNDDLVAATAEVRPTSVIERPPTPADFDHGPDDDHAEHVPAAARTDTASPGGPIPVRDGLYRSGVGHGDPDGGGLWPEGVREALSERWRDVHQGFVDDPRRAVDQALSIVDDAAHVLASRLAARRRELSALGEADTEELRLAVRRCHGLFDELVR